MLRGVVDLKALFDKFGEAGLKEGVPDNSGGEAAAILAAVALDLYCRGSQPGPVAGYLGGNYSYAQNGNEIFESFFGTANPFATIVEGAY